MAMEYSYADNKPQSIYNVNYTIFCVFSDTKKMASGHFQMQIIAMYLYMVKLNISTYISGQTHTLKCCLQKISWTFHYYKTRNKM